MFLAIDGTIPVPIERISSWYYEGTVATAKAYDFFKLKGQRLYMVQNCVEFCFSTKIFLPYVDCSFRKITHYGQIALLGNGQDMENVQPVR